MEPSGLRGPARRWACDSEFLKGDLGGEVTCVTFSNGDPAKTFLFWADEADAMYRFLEEHKFYYLFVWKPRARIRFL